MSRNSRILNLLNFRLKITIKDGRQFIGQMIAFDKHLNLVLSDCQEVRILKKQEKRTLGLVILRGEEIVSIQVEQAPKQQEKKPMPVLGQAKPMGRGIPVMQKPLLNAGPRV